MKKAMSFKQAWLVKQEPTDFSWSDLVREGETSWTGVRNFQARNHLRAMKAGDAVLFYHTGDEKQVVGLARVKKGPYPDPTAKEGDWVAVDLEPVRPLGRTITLEEIKKNPLLKNLPLIRQGRLSVMPVSREEFDEMLG